MLRSLVMRTASSITFVTDGDLFLCCVGCDRNRSNSLILPKISKARLPSSLLGSVPAWISAIAKSYFLLPLAASLWRKVNSFHLLARQMLCRELGYFTEPVF